jgi:hypothetical protein
MIHLATVVFVKFNGDEFKENQYFDFGSYSSRILTECDEFCGNVTLKLMDMTLTCLDSISFSL